MIGFVAWEMNLTENSNGGLPERDSVEGAESDTSTLGGCGRSLRVSKETVFVDSHLSDESSGGGSFPCEAKYSRIISFES